MVIDFLGVLLLCANREVVWVGFGERQCKCSEDWDKYSVDDGLII